MKVGEPLRVHLFVTSHVCMFSVLTHTVLGGHFIFEQHSLFRKLHSNKEEKQKARVIEVGGSIGTPF